MKKVKSLFSFIICISLLVVATSCQLGSKPENTISKMNDALKAGQLEEVATFFKDGNPEEMNEFLADDAEETTKLFVEYFKTSLTKMEYTIDETVVDGDTATIKATYTYVDGSEILSNTLTEYFQEALSQMMTATESDIEKLLVDTFNKNVTETEEKLATKQVTFTLEKVENEWKISDADDAFIDVFSANFYSVYSELGNALGQ